LVRNLNDGGGGSGRNWNGGDGNKNNNFHVGESSNNRYQHEVDPGRTSSGTGRKQNSIRASSSLSMILGRLVLCRLVLRLVALALLANLCRLLLPLALAVLPGANKLERCRWCKMLLFLADLEHLTVLVRVF